MSPAQVGNALETAAAHAARRAASYLAELQAHDGHWCAELTADTTLESDYILFQLWLYPPVAGNWDPPTRPLIDKAVRSILARQLADGGFNIYVDGPAEISASVKAYFALKLAGVDADGESLRRLRERILALGGIQSANSYVKVNLSLFDLYPRQYTPSIPPEVVLLPGKFLYQMSAWSRDIVLPLGIVHASNPRKPVPAGFDLGELWAADVSPRFRKDESPVSWHNFFLATDWLLKWWERRGMKAVRRRAVEKAGDWMVDRLEHTDGLGAIFPSMMYVVMALDALGYEPEDPLRARALSQFNDLIVDDGERFFLQPCFSPVWDTAIISYALASWDGERAGLAAAADWLLDHEIRRKGDWAVKRRDVEPSGWAFEYSNEFYPDIDDTAMVLLALRHVSSQDRARQRACHQWALNWLLAMQSKDGGWAAFDADNNWAFLSQVPFADHNAILDPTCADITGRVLEALAARSGLAGAASGSRRKLVRALGRGVHLWHLLRFARPGGSGRERPRSAYPARGRVAALDSECRRRLGRKLRQLRPRHLYGGAQHAVADRVGDSGADCRRRRRFDQRAARYRIPGGNAARRRKLGRRTFHRDRFSQSLLSELPPL